MKRQKLKSEKQKFFSPMSNLKIKSKVFIPTQKFFFLLFGISTGHLSSGTFHPNYPKFQCSEKHICVIKEKKKAHFVEVLVISPDAPLGARKQ